MRTLDLLDSLAGEGRASFTAREVRERLSLSSAAAANLLTRLRAQGLVDRVTHGRYVIRQLGLLGTSAASEDVTLAVGALFEDAPHRIAYRSALDLLGLLTHPSRTIQVASPHRIRIDTLSDRPLQCVIEPEETILVGAKREGHAWVSDIERALLDAAARPNLAGGVAAIVEAASSGDANPDRIIEYARRLNVGAALRRLGSIADALHIEGLAGRLQPLSPPLSDIDLEPGRPRDADAWRDRIWRVRWPSQPNEFQGIVER